MKYSINSSTVLLNKNIITEESLNIMCKEIDFSYNSCSKAIEAYNLVSNVKAMENFGYKATEGLGENIKNGARFIWEKIKWFFKKIVTFFKFIGSKIIEFFTFIKNFINQIFPKQSKRKQHPLTNQQIDDIIKNVDNNENKTQDSLQLQNTISNEANGEFSIQRSANVNGAQINGGGKYLSEIADELANFLSKHNYFIEYESKYYNRSTQAYSLHYVLAEFYGKESADRLIQEYHKVSEIFKKYLQDFTNREENNSDFNRYKISRDDFWKFGNFDGMTKSKREFGYYILNNYSSDNTIKLSNDSKKLIEVLNKECKINLTAAENHLRVLETIKEYPENTSNETKYYYEQVMKNISEFIKINNDLINLCRTTISISSDLEKLYSKIDKFLGQM